MFATFRFGRHNSSIFDRTYRLIFTEFGGGYFSNKALPTVDIYCTVDAG
jgi:hypothetical protein